MDTDNPNSIDATSGGLALFVRVFSDDGEGSSYVYDFPEETSAEIILPVLESMVHSPETFQQDWTDLHERFVRWGIEAERLYAGLESRQPAFNFGSRNVLHISAAAQKVRNLGQLVEEFRRSVQKHHAE